MALIGAHMSVAGGLDKAFERADALGCESMQIFTRSQRQWQARPVSLQEAEGFYRAWQRSNVKAVVSHASYLINIASPDAAVRAKSAAALREEVERCRHLNIDDIVLHPGFAMDAGIDAATANIAETLLRLFDATQEYKTRILLETMAGQGTCVGGDFAHFTEILDKANWHPRIGLCIDTCHVFAACARRTRTSGSSRRRTSTSAFRACAAGTSTTARPRGGRTSTATRISARAR